MLILCSATSFQMYSIVSPDRNGEPASQDTLAFPISVIILQMRARGQD